MKKILIRLHDIDQGDNKGFVEKVLQYNECTTLKDILKEFELNDVNAFEYPFALGSNEKGESITCVRYIEVDERVEWLMSLGECRLIDYIDTYKFEEIDLYVPKNIGGPSLPYLDWEFILANIELLFTWVDYALTAAALYKAASTIKTKFLDSKRSQLTLDTVKEYIKRRDCWSLDEFKFKMGLESHTEVAELLLCLCGYIYDRKTNLYFYNVTVENMRNDEFRDAFDEYVDKFGWDRRFE